MIHDAARPFLTGRHIEGLLQALDGVQGALLALPVADTLKRQTDGAPVATVDREGLWRAQTPQAFRYAALRQGYAAWTGAADPTDDAAAIEAAGGTVRLVARRSYAVQAHLCGGLRHGRRARGRRLDHPDRPGHRRPPFRSRRRGVAVRGPDRPRPWPDRPFGRRCGAARLDRRHPRRHRRGRYRRSLPAVRRQMEGRALAPVPDPRRRSGARRRRRA